jgi:hypothetical protein
MDWKHLLSLRDLARFLRVSPPASRSAANDRVFTRVPLTLEANLLTKDTPLIVGQTKDVSLTGLYLFSDQQLSVGTECDIALVGNGRSPSSLIRPSRPIQVSGRIVHVTDAGMGIALREILGSESLDKLRALLLEHAPEGRQVSRELQRVTWSEATRVAHPASAAHRLLMTKFSVRRGDAQPQTAIELSPGWVALLSDDEVAGSLSLADVYLQLLGQDSKQ